MPLQTGSWTINTSGNVGEVVITGVDASGNLNGTLSIAGLPPAPTIGYWDEITQEISFWASIGLGGDIAMYTGHLFADSMRIGGISGAVVYTLAGTARLTSVLGGSARRHLFGWYAQIGVD